MKKAIFVILDEYADWEGAQLAAQLNQSPDWEVKTASNEASVGSIGGFKAQVDLRISDITEDVELLVLIGGHSWSLEDATLKAVIAKRLANHQAVAAICGEVDYLAKNGLLTGFKHTGNSQYLWQDYTAYRNQHDFMAKQVVRDGSLVTANGSAALAFTNQVLKMVHFDSDQQIDQKIDLYVLGFYQYCEKYGNPFI